MEDAGIGHPTSAEMSAVRAKGGEGSDLRPGSSPHTNPTSWEPCGELPYLRRHEPLSNGKCDQQPGLALARARRMV